jgi:hypothetical protein
MEVTVLQQRLAAGTANPLLSCEAGAGIEPASSGFAIHCLSTWLPGPDGMLRVAGEADAADHDPRHRES